MNLAVIPARGGSKRIPRKNIKPFCGKPMIAYAISAAAESGLFDHIIVSTDDDEIADIARAFGAETPFVRPAELANDHTATAPVLAHAIDACHELGWLAQYVCCIYPCVPLIQVSDIKYALQRLLDTDSNYCFPVTPFPSAVQRALKRTEEGMMQPLYPEFEMVRTQDLDPAYYDVGQFYWGKTSAWQNMAKIHSGGIGIVIPGRRVVDIDTPEDWQRAEHIARSNLSAER